MSLTVEDESDNQEGLGMVLGGCMGMFYAYDGMIRSREPEWIQGAINVIINPFRGFRLVSNVAKYKTMACQPGKICTGIPEETFSRGSKGEGGTYPEHLKLHIP